MQTMLFIELYHKRDMPISARKTVKLEKQSSSIILNCSCLNWKKRQNAPQVKCLRS